MGSGRARRRLADLVLLLLAAGVVGLVGLALRPAEPGTAVLSPADRSAPAPATGPPPGDPSPSAAAPTAGPAPTAEPTATAEPGRGAPVAAAALGDGLVDDDGWYAMLVSSPGSPLRNVLNAGVPGQTAQQVAARVPAVLEADPQVVLVQAGTNDLLKGVPQATTLAALRAVVTRLTAAGVVPVLAAVPPNDAMAARVGPLNSSLTTLGQQLSVPVLDPWADVRQADGSWITGTSEDGVEPTPESSRRAADAARESLSGLELPAG